MFGSADVENLIECLHDVAVLRNAVFLLDGTVAECWLSVLLKYLAPPPLGGLVAECGRVLYGRGSAMRVLQCLDLKRKGVLIAGVVELGAGAIVRRVAAAEEDVMGGLFDFEGVRVGVRGVHANIM